MKITRIKLNCSEEAEMKRDISTDSALFYFKSPVVFSKAGRRIKMRGNSAAIFSSGYMQNFQPALGTKFCCDYVLFRMSAGDKQYLSASGIPIDEPIEVGDDYVVSGILRCMKAQSMRQNSANDEFMELSLRTIFIALNGSEEGVHEKDVPHLNKLRKLRDEIYSSPAEIWEADILAEKMGISRSYFHRIYLAAFGVTCRQDAIESRLQYAAELLRDNSLTLSEIAEKCGYESDSYFMRQFKQHKGCTPTEYRKKILESEE